MGYTLIGNDNVIVTNMTLKDIALLTGTSVNTVSRALNKKDGVSPETRERILAVAEAHHYHPNLLARSMRLKDIRLVGILVGDITNPFFVSLLDGAYEEASAEAVTIIVGNSRENFGLQRESIDAFLSYNCSGIALCLIEPDTALVQKLQTLGLNFVIIDTHIDGSSPCDRVHIDDEADCMRAIEYLHSCGHTRIDVISSAIVTVNERDRIVGVKKAFASCGLPWEEGRIHICRNREDACARTVESLRGPDRPTAFFICKEAYSLGVISAIMSLGLRIPDDVSLLIYGDPEWASIFYPKCTCMRRPVREMGRIGMRILCDRMNGIHAERSQDITLCSELITRESVKVL